MWCAVHPEISRKKRARYYTDNRYGTSAANGESENAAGFGYYCSKQYIKVIEGAPQPIQRGRARIHSAMGVFTAKNVVTRKSVPSPATTTTKL